MKKQLVLLKSSPSEKVASLKNYALKKHLIWKEILRKGNFLKKKPLQRSSQFEDIATPKKVTGEPAYYFDEINALKMC